MSKGIGIRMYRLNMLALRAKAERGALIPGAGCSKLSFFR
uniref:Uncharacterized protein n=1 Tax=Candidatus Kentrum sp. TUN TaxID=2126343 RepID=A0A450ZP56_9GAMM|nr:MAG: hypothetical protein BECKTUN1418D_GA0071000_10343 [Candidatus Kentron sp. TUN]